MFFRRREAAERKTSVFSKIGMVTVLVLVVVVPVLAIGFWQGWFDVSANTKQGDWNVKFTVDPDEIKKDVETANPPEAPLVQ